MTELPLLLGYSAALVVASLAGGALPRRLEMTHTRTQVAMSLVSGLMLGIAFFHLLPHAVLTIGTEQGLGSAMQWAMVGLVAMLLLLRLFHFHQPDYHPAEAEHGDCPGAGPHLHPEINVTWRGVLVGLAFHTFVDGVALGAALLGTQHGHSQALLGFGVFLAILLHKPLDAMSIAALMKAGGASPATRGTANLVFALVCPVGALVFFFYGSASGASTAVIAAALAFSAGAFVCIALSDLLPEVQFHSHDRVKLTGAFLLGIALALLLANATPDHGHALPEPLPGSPTTPRDH
jgi:zinc and cadmium transporter